MNEKMPRLVYPPEIQTCWGDLLKAELARESAVAKQGGSFLNRFTYVGTGNNLADAAAVVGLVGKAGRVNPS